MLHHLKTWNDRTREFGRTQVETATKHFELHFVWWY